MPLNLYDTYKRKLVTIEPIEKGKIGFYSCGPTVYDFVHIGNLRTYIFNDTLKRALKYLGYKVKHIMNITDVGHLVSDEDAGEDKLEKGAKREGKTVWEVARYYTKFFLADIEALNIEMPEVMPRATETIPEMIEIVKILLEKGAAYETDEAIYFDISKFPDYEKLTGQKFKDKKQGARDEVVTDPQKKNPADFALWFKTVGRFKEHTMHWSSP